MVTRVMQSLAATYCYVVAFLGLDLVARTSGSLPGAFQAPQENNPIAIFTSFVIGPMWCTTLLALGVLVKVINTSFQAIDGVLVISSRIPSFFGIAFNWRIDWDTRAAINRFLDNVLAAVTVFFDVSPYTVLVAPIADPCTKGFRKAKASRRTAGVTKLLEGASNLAYGVLIRPAVSFATAMYNIYMDTVAAISSFAISSWVATSTLPIYFLWASCKHGLRGAIGLTAAHGITFTPSSVASALHRTTATFLQGFGIDCPKLATGTKTGKTNSRTAVNLTASSTVNPP